VSDEMEMSEKEGDFMHAIKVIYEFNTCIFTAIFTLETPKEHPFSFHFIVVTLFPKCSCVDLLLAGLTASFP